METSMTIRLTYLLSLVVTIFLLLISIYLQFYVGILPCPLCTLQRCTFVLLGILFFFGIFLCEKFWGRMLINTLISLISILGLFLAGRQVWLQNFATADNNECGVGLQYMIQVLPLNEVLKKIFAGGSECTQRGWEFLHLNMAEWSLIWFSLFLLTSIYLFLKEFKRKKRHF